MHNGNPTVDPAATSTTVTGGIQRAPRPSSHYTCIHNDVLRDTRLSFRALGVLVEILSRPDNWKTRAETLAASRGHEGRDAVRTALNELEAAGYLVRRKVRGERGRISTVSMIYDRPQGVDQREQTKPQVAPETGKPTPGLPAVGGPDAGGLGPLRTPETNTRKERSVSEVEWSNSVGRAKDDQKDQKPKDHVRLTVVEGVPDSGIARTFIDWRAEDRELFRTIVGDEMASDGSTWTAGTFPAEAWYEALRNHATKPIDWPGRYLDQLLDNGGFDTWLLTKGLDVYQQAA